MPSQTDPQPEEPKDGENATKNWKEEQDNPKFKPTLNLRKVDRNFPNLGNQLEKLKADREERERKTNKENKIRSIERRVRGRGDTYYRATSNPRE